MSDTTENRSSKVTAGLVIIGDEILKGHTKDLNASFLLSKLWSNGIHVKKVSFVPDDVKSISDEVLEYSNKYSLVITAGGIGPTHDDVTYEAVAKAVNEPLKWNDELAEVIKRVTKKDSLASIEKMVLVPASSKLYFGVDNSAKFPLLSVKNIYLFPGIPEYLQQSFQKNEKLFSGDSKFLLMKIYLSADEDAITDACNKVDKAHSHVHLGSYPILRNHVYKTKLTLESEDSIKLEAAYDDLIKKIPTDVIVSVRKCIPNSRDTHEEIFVTKNTSLPRILSNTSCKFRSLFLIL